MRKGEEKRQELLDAAERLFCQQGYEATAISDLMAALKLSKGGFYHHFSSKDAVLSALCQRHANQAAASLAADAAAHADPIARIDAVLHAYMPLRRDNLDFLRVLLPYLHQSASRSVALAYQEALLASFLPRLEEALDAARQAGKAFPEVRGVEKPVLHLVNQLWLDAAHLMPCEPAELLALLGVYRRAIELLLGAPFGSIQVIRVEDLAALGQPV